VTIIPTDDRLVPLTDERANIRAIAQAFLPAGARVFPITSDISDYKLAGNSANAKLSELVTPPSGHHDSAGDLVVKMKCCSAWGVARMSACDMRESCRQESRISLR